MEKIKTKYFDVGFTQGHMVRSRLASVTQGYQRRGRKVRRSHREKNLLGLHIFHICPHLVHICLHLSGGKVLSCSGISLKIVQLYSD